jgi:hypothetical protein
MGYGEFLMKLPTYGSGIMPQGEEYQVLNTDLTAV